MQKHCISVEDVYYTAAPKVPQGYELTGEFRPFTAGETVLLTNGKGAHKAFVDGSALYPRLILRATPTIRDIYGKELSELKPPEGYEFGEFRRVQTGEDWMDAYGDLLINHAEVDPPGGGYRLILKKVTTIEEVYGASLEKLTPPIGYRFTGEFRKPTAEDVCLLPDRSGGIIGTVQYEWIRPEDVERLDPRLILEKLPATPTIKDVYGTDNPPIPAGWKFKEFRQIGETEECVPYLSQAYYKVNDSKEPPGNLYDRWRIVLEQDLSQFRYTITPEYIYGGMLKVPEGYKVVDFKPPLTGELFLSLYGGNCDTARSNFASPRFILSPLGPR